MSKISKTQATITPKNLKAQKHKNHNYIPKSNEIPNATISKQLAYLSLLGASLLTSCELDTPKYIQPEEVSKTIESKQIINQIDNGLNLLGIITTPFNSILEAKTFAFKSDKNDDYYFKLEKINKHEILIKQLKYDENLQRENSDLYISKINNGLLVHKVKGYNNTVKFMYIIENNAIKMFKENDGLFFEISKFEKTKSGHFVQTFADGTKTEYSEIKNNIEFPDNIYFEETDEKKDDVIFE